MNGHIWVWRGRKEKKGKPEAELWQVSIAPRHASSQHPDTPSQNTQAEEAPRLKQRTVCIMRR